MSMLCFNLKQDKARHDTKDQKDTVPPQIPGPSYSPGQSSNFQVPSTHRSRQPRWEKDEGSSAGSDANNRLPIEVLIATTDNFNDNNLLGSGGFGPVYSGTLPNGQVVAVKVLDETGRQGAKEFLTEILVLSHLRHPNLVQMIGYCQHGSKRIVVYELLPLGSLDYHLSGSYQPLDWRTRMKIAVGAARGLNYLHNEANPPIIYRDMKPANILLDHDFNPKLSDFGLAVFFDMEVSSIFPSALFGTPGYSDPQYHRTGELTPQSDVYGFGVVLLELITGRDAFYETAPADEKRLAQWARKYGDQKDWTLLADKTLKGKFPGKTLTRLAELAIKCTDDDPKMRPDMSEVVIALNYLDAEEIYAGTSSTQTEGSKQVSPEANLDYTRAASASAHF
ncbi:Protein kinase domain [Dillenia turbinata]|uniref:Protein kinase domain n=1 Tax=Dillenia turbinata TaxID=194707 RepID=A0AAN8UCJ4_9MAGN